MKMTFDLVMIGSVIDLDGNEGTFDRSEAVVAPSAGQPGEK